MVNEVDDRGMEGERRIEGNERVQTERE